MPKKLPWNGKASDRVTLQDNVRVNLSPIQLTLTISDVLSFSDTLNRQVLNTAPLLIALSDFLQFFDDNVEFSHLTPTLIENEDNLLLADAIILFAELSIILIDVLAFSDSIRIDFDSQPLLTDQLTLQDTVVIDLHADIARHVSDTLGFDDVVVNEVNTTVITQTILNDYLRRFLNDDN